MASAENIAAMGVKMSGAIPHESSNSPMAFGAFH
jgi:hypothetical protein